jgi:acetylornithine deacetylase/succinyl-diaminopimelate desuccinylase-like protein
VFPPDVQSKYVSRKWPEKKMMTVLRKEPAAVVVIADDSLLRSWKSIRSRGKTESIIWGDKKRRVSPRRRTWGIYLVKPDMAEFLFKGQGYDPTGIKTKGIEGYKVFELADTNIKIDMVYLEEPIQPPNVVGYLKGTDPELNNQYVTIGAHLDHIPPRNGQVCNGADDNASGVCGVLEIAEALAHNPPRRSIIFILYSGEEIGLYGSKYFVNHCPVPVEDIIVNLNLDVIGRSGRNLSDSDGLYALESDRICSDLTDIIRNVNERTVKRPIEYSFPSRYGTTDHRSFHTKHIPGVHFFTGVHEDLHRPTDDTEKIDFAKMRDISELVFEIAVELANRDTRLCMELLPASNAESNAHSDGKT